MRRYKLLHKKGTMFWLMFIAIAVTVLLALRFTANPKQVQMIPNLYQGYDIKALMENKTPYVGDNVKGIALIDAMPLPQGIVRDKVELQTEAQPYGMTINFIMNDASGVMKDGAISGHAFYRNVMLLFSLIDNVDVIKCKIADKTGNYNGASYEFPYTRKMVEKLMDTDVRLLAESEEELKRLIDRINNASYLQENN